MLRWIYQRGDLIGDDRPGPAPGAQELSELRRRFGAE